MWGALQSDTTNTVQPVAAREYQEKDIKYVIHQDEGKFWSQGLTKVSGEESMMVAFYPIQRKEG